MKRAGTTCPQGRCNRAGHLALAAFLTLLAGCAEQSAPRRAQAEPPAPAPVTAPPPAPAPAPLAWETGDPARQAWSAQLRDGIRARLSDFERAEDGPRFCPAWDRLGAEARVDVLAALAVGVARFESGYNPAARAGRSKGPQWVGLFQLSSSGFAACAKATGGKLTDPQTNIACAVPAMARLVREDRRLAGGDGQPAARGIARWWHVLWPGGRGTLAKIRATTLALPACAG